MKRLAALLVLAFGLAACGGTVEGTAPPLTKAQGPAFLARTAGLSGPLTGYDVAGLDRRFELPGGIQAADGRSYYALEGSKLLRFSTLTGKVTRSYPVRGEWKLAGVSANGAWVALSRPGTEIQVLDTKRGVTTHELELAGNFTVETISTAGDFLFLQQNFVDGSYAVRGYDLAANQMLPGSLGNKGNIIQMTGLASQVVASPDGRWLLTMYINTKSNTAFVHALNLIERIATCINLPPCTNCDRKTLRGWGLALAPDGQTLFAANPAAGRVATIYLPARRVIAESRFIPQPGGETRTAVSPDGSQFAFTNGEKVWAFDTKGKRAQDVATDGGAVADLGFSPDGKLLLARKGASLLALDL